VENSYNSLFHSYIHSEGPFKNLRKIILIWMLIYTILGRPSGDLREGQMMTV
jgi:hypothetical protein